MADSNPFDIDSDSDSSFYGFSHEEFEEPERRTENRRINFNADNSLDLSVDEYSSSDTETQKVVTMKLTTTSTCKFLINKTGIQSKNTMLCQSLMGMLDPQKFLAAVKKEGDFFNSTFPSDLYHIIAEQTNLYAWQKQAQNCNDPKWMETNSWIYTSKFRDTSKS